VSVRDWHALVQFARLQAGAIATLVLLGVIALAVELAAIGAFIVLLGVAQGAQPADLPLFGAITRALAGYSPGDRLIIVALIIAVLGLARGLTAFCRNVLQSLCFTRLSQDLHASCYARFLELPPARLLEGDSASFVNTMVSFPREAATATIGLAQVAISAVSAFGYLVVVFVLSWRVGILVVLLSAATGSLAWVVLFRSIGAASATVNDTSVRFYAWIMETVRGRSTIDALGLQDHVYARLRERGREMAAANLHRERLRALVDPILTVAGFAVIAGLLASVAWSAGDLPERLTGAIVIVLCLVRMMGPLSQLNASFADIRTYSNSVARVAEFLATKAAPPRTGAHFPGIQKRLGFRDVVFRYDKAEVPALDGVTFDVAPRRVVALVGRSGAGKTSVVALLMRYFEPTAGSVEVDGTPISTYDEQSWRQRVALVPQEPFLFDDTVEANIRAGWLAASADDIRRAAAMAHAAEFIDRLPRGYGTLVGENGVRLSGGQRQRIAIARAVLRRPEIVVLDEATSHLDSESEHAIRLAIEDLRKQCAVLIVAHRLSTIVGADTIIVLDRGRVVEHGTHAELLARGGLYTRLVQFQALEARDHAEARTA
jgi:subfamily B ATP-binding cassette protein MsbA